MSTHAPSAPTHPITLTRAAMMALASAWSIALGVIALWIALDPASPIDSPIARTAAAVAILCAAQLLFLVSVAQRLFAHTPRRLVRRIHASLAVTLAFAAVTAIATVSIGAAP